jgi:hypothetical protein
MNVLPRYFTSKNKNALMMDSMTILEGLGDDPSSHDLDSVISLRVEEYLTTDISSYDYESRESIPQYHKTKLCFGRFILGHLRGNGSRRRA